MARRSTPARSREFVLLVALALAGGLVGQAWALLHIDFEQRYFVHPGTQVWDFCLVLHDGSYNIFYHAIPEATPSPDFADYIWRATSDDLIHWSEPTIVLSVSADHFESRAIWAPDIVHDDETGMWWMAYTGVDELRNQRICMAWSRDLATWFKTRYNPVLEPDPDTFFYFPDYGWSECRDPFLYRQAGQWHMLASAKVLGIVNGRGALAHSVSDDLMHWSAPDVFLANDGPTPWNTPESPQYLVRDGIHHVFFLEYSDDGISHIASLDPPQWTFENRWVFDAGIAPEVDSFDGGASWVISRVAPYLEPDAEVVSYVARFDTLLFNEGTASPQIYRAPPLAREFASYGGLSCLGNPCFGDNPARRGEDPVGLVGNCFFGSREYYQGPLSLRGDTGRLIGDSATGYADSYPFIIEGNSISLLVSGTYSPDHCFVALMSAADHTILRRSYGYDSVTMTPRWWDVSELQGQEVYIRIEDSDTAGYINVDEIVESFDVVTAAGESPPAPAAVVVDLGPAPNPFNPETSLRFELGSPASCRVLIHDLRGRQIWDSGAFAGRTGENRVVWPGMAADGRVQPGGVYVYRIVVDGSARASGKLTLVP
ncbi:MAG TPA: hypothetical protein PLL30_05380 [Candidatus Krumholzibacteria bacterium]|nr:hypothetical protein [Candidatus Krumholzibacteria bacterium]HPD71193.1 hypothetical protein [Candidatus Krumholzibacteria bacterium]HRY39107.1 hypothetical protein [Candidatus Krumholzibacteria bacterium]